MQDCARLANMARAAFFCFLTVQTFSANAGLITNEQFGWLAPGTTLSYKKNACNIDTLVGGYSIEGSLEAVAQSAYDYYYQSGSCVADVSIVNTVPATFPATYDYADFLKQHPSPDHVYQTHRYTYTCTQVGDGQETSSFSFDVEPLFTCTGGGCYQEVPNCIGDILGRDLDIHGIEKFGHTALFAGENVLEILNDGPEIINLNPLSTLVNKTKYWGSGYGVRQDRNGPELSYQEGVNIINAGLAQRKFYPEYSLMPMYVEGHYIIEDNQINYEKGMFRCDTFVKYAYKKALNIDLTPIKGTELPRDQWQATPYKRTLMSEGIPSEPIKDSPIWAIMSDQQLTDKEKSTRLITLQSSTSDSELSRAIYDAMRAAPVRDNIVFLLSAYQHSKDTKTKLVALSALRQHYVVFKNRKDDLLLVGELAAIKHSYKLAFNQSINMHLKRRAIEDVTKVFQPEEAYLLLKELNPYDPEYRAPYLSTLLITLLNTQRDQELLSTVQTMSACERNDHRTLFEMARDHGLLSQALFSYIDNLSLNTTTDDVCTTEIS